MQFSPTLCGSTAVAQPSLAPRNSPSQAPRELFRLPPACSRRVPGGCPRVWERTSQDCPGVFSNQAGQHVPEPNAPGELKKGKSRPIKLFVLVLHPFSIRISWKMCLDRGLHETCSPWFEPYCLSGYGAQLAPGFPRGICWFGCLI